MFVQGSIVAVDLTASRLRARTITGLLDDPGGIDVVDNKLYAVVSNIGSNLSSAVQVTGWVAKQ